MNFAVVFPGQGSQSIGMLKALADEHAVVQETFTEAADVLGKDFWALAQNGADTDIGVTRITQPLMLIGGVAVWRVLNQVGLPKPTAMAGHSLGEFTAMVASEAISFADGLKVVQRRAELMAVAVPEGEGGMAALLGMDDSAVIEVCEEVDGDRVVNAVNFNAPGQVAISGHKDALAKAVELAKERGARKAIMLPVSVPNHSSLMRDAGEKLVETIDSLDWNSPSVPLVQNAQAAVAADKEAMIASLRAHVYSPVQWTKTVELLRDKFGVNTLVESGPGKVLSGLGKRIDRKLTSLPCESPEALHAVVDALCEKA